MIEALSRVLGILVCSRFSFLVGIANYLVRTTDPIGALEQDTRFELALSAWKADVLTANTNPADLQQKRSVGTVRFPQT